VKLVQAAGTPSRNYFRIFHHFKNDKSKLQRWLLFVRNTVDGTFVIGVRSAAVKPFCAGQRLLTAILRILHTKRISLLFTKSIGQTYPPLQLNHSKRNVE